MPNEILSTKPDGFSHNVSMRFFRHIQSHVDVNPLLAEIDAQEHLWLHDVSRQTNAGVQRDTNSIFLRVASNRRDLPANENQETRPTRMVKAFPRAIAFMESFAEEMQASLQRAMIVRLKPHSIVYRHIDAGSYYFLRDRFHLVLRSASGSALGSGDEEVLMWPGELWWFDNKQHHWARNDGPEWRIHYIFDLLAPGLKDLARNPIAVPEHSPYAIAVPDFSVNADRRNDDSARSRLESGIRSNAILRSDKQLLVSPSGGKCNWLIDMRRVLTNPCLLDAAADVFWDTFKDKLPFQVGGMETAAIPLVSAIQMKSVARGTPVNAFIVRKERKTHGAGNVIEGTVTGDSIIIIDDVLNSGRSIEKVRSVLDAYGRCFSDVFVVIDYRSQRGEMWRKENGIKVSSPFTLADFDLRLEPKEDKYIPSLFKVLWKFRSERPSFHHRVPKSFPVTDGNRLFFGSDSGKFWALDAKTGSVAWDFQVRTTGDKNIFSSPALCDGRVYFGGYDGNVYCLSADTGEEIWRFCEADWVGSSPALAPDRNLLYVGLEFAVPGKQGSIAALNMESGKKVWEHLTKRYTHASPAYWRERGIVACGSNDNELLLFEASSGKQLWRFETHSHERKGSIRHAPAFDFKRAHVITGSANGNIYIVDVETGKEVWSVATDNEIYTVPLCVDDTAFVGSTDKHMYVLDLEQQVVKKKIAIRSKVYGPPTLIGGAVYFGACNGLIYKVDCTTGDVLGVHQLPDAITNAITYSADTGLFYVLTYVNELYALSL